MSNRPENIGELIANMSPDIKALNSEALGLAPSINTPPAREKSQGASLSGVKGKSEASFQKEVIEHLQSQGYLVCEFRKARVKKGGIDVYRTPFGADGVGFTDLVAVHPIKKVIWFIEDKSDEGKAAPEQVKWLLATDNCQTRSICLTPAMWEDFKEVV